LTPQESSPTPQLSRLGLGTVQWGMKYGIANTAGQPGPGEVAQMLRAAHECGVSWLDTARAYGESEEVVGKALEETGLRDEFTIVSKVCHIDPDAGDAPAQIEQSVAASMAALGVEHIPILLVHKGTDLHVPGVWEEMLRQKRKGNAGRLGVSISHEPVKTVGYALGLESMEAVQVAINVFDQRLARAGVLDQLAARGVLVFVRSVYLQGLIIMPQERVPEHLADALPFRREVAQRAAQWGRDLKEVAVQFVLGLPGVTSAVIGCEAEEQVRDNASLVASAPLTGDQMDALLAMPEAPAHVVEPWQWEGRTKAEYRKPSEKK